MRRRKPHLEPGWELTAEQGGGASPPARTRHGVLLYKLRWAGPDGHKQLDERTLPRHHMIATLVAHSRPKQPGGLDLDAFTKTTGRPSCHAFRSDLASAPESPNLMRRERRTVHARSHDSLLSRWLGFSSQLTGMFSLWGLASTLVQAAIMANFRTTVLDPAQIEMLQHERALHVRCAGCRAGRGRTCACERFWTMASYISGCQAALFGGRFARGGPCENNSRGN